MRRNLLLVMCITFLFTMVIHSKAEARFLGIFGPSPKPKLYHYGMTDKEIKNVQTKLIKFEYLNDIADGIFGNNTLKDLFEYNGIPQVMVYNREKILQKVYYKDIYMDSVILYMNK